MVLTFDWPLWLVVVILGVEGWPYVLAAGLGLAVLAALTRGWLRAIAIILLLPCAAILCVVIAWDVHARMQSRETDAFEARIHETLEQDRVVNGIALPAGTDIQWADVDRRELRYASPPDPIPLFGLRVTWLGRADSGSGWDLQLPEPEQIDGWTCDRIGVRVSETGVLQSCTLAAGRMWHGWPIPTGSLLDLTTSGTVGLALTGNASMPAPEIGHTLTATGGFSLNADGSLARYYFEDADPLLVAGQRLCNTVEWSYDPATLGRGRRRPALTVRGNQILPNGDFGGNVVIRLSDGDVQNAD